MSQYDVALLIAGALLGLMLVMLGYGLYLSALSVVAEKEAEKKRAARFRALPVDYEEVTEPRAGFGGSDWRDAGAPLRRGPQERTRG